MRIIIPYLPHLTLRHQSSCVLRAATTAEAPHLPHTIITRGRGNQRQSLHVTEAIIVRRAATTAEAPHLPQPTRTVMRGHAHTHARGSEAHTHARGSEAHTRTRYTVRREEGTQMCATWGD